MLHKISVVLLLFFAFMLMSCTQGETDSKYQKTDPNQTNDQIQKEKSLDEDQITSPIEKQDKPTPEAEKETSSEEINIKVTFIELGSKDCVPCKMMEPILEQIREEYPDQVKVVFHDVKTKEGYAYAQQYKIRVIPTQVFLDSNGEEYFRHEGFFPKEEVVKILMQKGVK